MENKDLYLIKGVHDQIIDTIIKNLPPHAEVETGNSFNASGELVYGEKYSIATISPETGEYAGHYVICYIWEEDPEL